MHYSTTAETLTKFPKSMLGVMFSGKYKTQKDKDGRYFMSALLLIILLSPPSPSSPLQ